ncbi:hypothetical protein P4113_09670 [Pseudomonas aeruginosa]|nr:hypothetical protein [Pseudomonas aeruginosa]MDF5863374.1 hypothetical protein [Pseudomonas aeruginosa]
MAVQRTPPAADRRAGRSGTRRGGRPAALRRPAGARLPRPARSAGRLAGLLGRRNDLAGRPRFGLHEFTRLERRADQAIAYGLVGRFWRADFALERIADGEHFRCYDQPGVAKLVLCFRCTPSASGTLLHTETRVFCPDRASRLRFTPYWVAIRPVSGLIRRRLLAGIERRLG